MAPYRISNKLYIIYRQVWLIGLLLISSVLLHAQTADFTIKIQNACVPATVNFKESSTGGKAVNWVWDLGKGVIPQNVDSVGANYNDAGLYYITLTVTFENGVTRQVTKNIKIHPKPVADFSADVVSGCGPLTVKFNDLSTSDPGEITKWTWSIGEMSDIIKNPEYTFSQVGNFTVALFVENEWGCKSQAAIKDQFIKVIDRPTPAFTIMDNSNCEIPFTPVFNNTTTGPGTITYEWDFGDGTTKSTDLNPVHAYTAVGIYKVTLKASNGTNCDRTSAAQTIYVGRPPGTPVLTASSNICVNNSVGFTISGVANEWLDKVEWNFGNGSRTGNSTSASQTYNTPGDYAVKATVYYFSGCQEELTTNITVYPKPSVSVAASPAVACSFPFTTSFTATPSPANPDYTYEWNFGDGSAAVSGKGLTTVPHTFNNDGNFHVTVKITDPSNNNVVCNNATASTNIRVSIPSIAITRIIPDRQCKPVNAAFETQISNLLTSGTGIQYTWDFGDGSTPQTLTNNGISSGAIHHYSASGTYTVKVTAVTADGCSMTIQRPIIVPEDCPPPPPYPALPNGGFRDNEGACDNYLSYTFDAATINDTELIGWDFGDPASADNNTAGPVRQVTHVFSGPGTYTIKLARLFTPTGDTLVGTRDITITYDPLIFSVAASPTGTCPSTPVTISPVVLDPNRVRQYHWDFGDGKTLNISNASGTNTGSTSHPFDANGTYTVSLAITDIKGCKVNASATVDVIVNGPTADFEVDILTSCLNSFEVNFTPKATPIDPSAPITEWVWNFGDGLSMTRANADPVPHTYNNNSYYRAYNVSLTVSDANGCKSEVHVKPEYIKAYNPKASFYASSPMRCNEYDVRFYNHSSVRGEAPAPKFTYTWDYGDGTPLYTTHSSSSQSHVYPRDGEYTVKLIAIDENGCADTSILDNYVRIVHPKADFVPGSAITECAPISLDFENRSEVYGQNATYSWTFGYGSTRSTLHTPQPVIYPVPDDYTVTLTVESMGCVDVVEKVINVKGPRGTLHSEVFEGCIPLNIRMNVTGSNISSYAWDFDDGSVVTPNPDQHTVTHTYTHAGIYAPNIILTSPEGCAFTLRPPEKVVADSLQVKIGLSDTSFCGEGMVSFTNAWVHPAFSDITRQTWLMGDGSRFEGPLPPDHHYNTAGIYNVQLITETMFGCKDTARARVLIGEQPIVSINGPDLVCLRPGTDIRYRADITAAPNPVYQWQLDGADIGSNARLLNIISRQPGTYQLDLTVSSNGCIGTAQKQFIVDSVQARFRIDDSLHCGTGQVRFTNISTSASSIASYTWSIGDPAGNSLPMAGGTHQYVMPGTYRPSLTLETLHGCRDRFVLPEQIKVYKPPVLSFNAPHEICAENTVRFVASLQSEDEPEPIRWYLNNTLVDHGDDYSRYFDVAGSYNITAATATRYGCTTHITQPLVVNPLPVPNAQPVTTTICEGTPVQLHAEDGIHYQWSSDNGQLPGSNTANPEVSPSTHTKYRVLVRNQFGCTQTDSVMVNVDKKVNLVHSDNTVICVGEVVRLQASGNTSEFVWTPSASLTRADIPNPIARPTETTVYQITGKSTNVCPDETGYIMVAVGQYPTVELGPDLILKGGEVRLLQPLVSSDVVKYNWQPSRWLSCDNCKTPEVTASETTKYTLTVTNDYNCSTSDTLHIQVTCNRDAIYIPNSFTPNGDGLNDKFYIPGFGVEQIKSFTVYSRYGDVVYSQTNIPIGSKQYGWDGTINGKVVETTTVFVYTAEIICDGSPLFFKGTVTLIR